VYPLRPRVAQVTCEKFSLSANLRLITQCPQGFDEEVLVRDLCPQFQVFAQDDLS
jgi:hypothetical protein